MGCGGGRMSGWRVVAVVLASAAASGCSHVSDSYADGRTTRRVIGLVNMTIPLSRTPTVAGEADAVVVSSLGVSVYSGAETGSGLVLGYGRQALVRLGRDACVDLNAGGPCATLTTSKETAP